MERETQVFLDTTAALRDHANSLMARAASIEDDASFAPELEAVYDVSPRDKIPALLREAAKLCELFHDRIEAALAQAKAQEALTLLVSSMSHVDRLLWERRPDMEFENWGVPWLRSRIAPIYLRAVPLFDLDAEPYDLSSQEEFSCWLDENPNPWDGS
ncbi:hypothetical protein P8Q88_03495 [Qipengyuania sp. XHP0207]|uniref:hypothetical protein n=1 Tax=Qipengyuania sp. XHP0207 TaxID=3038078 RepID=UPI00241FF2DF|nr:hypothetical protein [Qipengyuania sp. XHP0207]MDG5747236.1 hypothetical protein [Qipengyuania sp. XHP0207]